MTESKKVFIDTAPIIYYLQNNREADMKLVTSFYSFINDMDIQVKSIDGRIAEKAAQRQNINFLRLWMPCS